MSLIELNDNDLCKKASKLFPWKAKKLLDNNQKFRKFEKKKNQEKKRQWHIWDELMDSSV